MFLALKNCHILQYYNNKKSRFWQKNLILEYVRMRTNSKQTNNTLFLSFLYINKIPGLTRHSKQFLNSPFN